MSQTKTLKLASDLIAIKSVTPEDNGCQELLLQRLEALNFTVERFDLNGVSNFYAKHQGHTMGPNFCFAGHTDVVPPGPLSSWDSPPFLPTLRNGFLYGRGAADMKSAIASMIVATEQFLETTSQYNGSISFLITSDEEGPAIHGTTHVIEALRNRGETIDYCIVGESSCSEVLGDTIKVGRRGSINARLTILGTQGHIAYPDLASNPVHKALPLLQALTAIIWDSGNEYFPPTSLQISNINAGTGATNVIPGELIIDFNVRFNPLQSTEDIQERINGLLQAYAVPHQLTWTISGLPYFTQAPELTAALSQVIGNYLKITPTLSTSGGTSDARFIATLGKVQVVEFGHINKTIHKANECVAVASLESLTQTYYALLTTLLRK